MAVEAGRETAAGAREPPRQPSHIIALAKQTAIYGLSGIAIQAIGVITLPVLGRVFTEAEYGKLELATVLSAVVISLVDAGFASAAQRSFYDYTDEQEEERRRVLFTALATITVLAVAAALALILAREQIASWFFSGVGDAPIVVLVAVSVPLVNTAMFLRETMRLRFLAWHYVASSLLASVVAAGLGIVAVVAFDLGVRGVLLGVIAGNLLALLYGAAVMHGAFGRRASGPELRTMAKYGLPLVPAALALWALALIDRIMLSKLAGLAEVGQYAVANRIANILLLGVTAFALAFSPYVFSLHAENLALERVVRAQALRYVTIGLSGAALALTLFGRELILVLAPAFDRSYEAVGLLALAVVIYGISTVVIAGIALARRTDLVAVITLAAAALNIGLNVALIPPLGMIGAALANLAAYALLAALYYVVAQRVYPTTYELWKILTVLGLACGLGILGVATIEPLALALLVKLAALGLFVALLPITGVVVPEEIERLREVLGGLGRTLPFRA